eukprot:274320_1
MSQQTVNYQRISADLIIPGTGSPIRNGIIIIKDNIISYVGSATSAPNIDCDPQLIKCIKVPIIMPGLWDCHVHFLGITKIAASLHKGDQTDIIATTPAAIAVGRSMKQLQTAINFGITSVREVGGYGLYLKQLINEGSIIGPNIYSAGKMLSITGGHGDFHKFPLSFMCQLCSTDNITNLVDGTSECLKAVRTNVRNGADIIKIHATGGVMSVNDALDSRQFSDEEIKTIVSEAARSGKIVAAHCHGREGIKACVENGVYTIEHGTCLDDALAKKMKEKNIILVPTRFIAEYFNLAMKRMGNENNLNEKSKKKAISSIERSRRSLKIALKYDVKIAMGTDMFVDNWGENAKELEYYVDAGMSELEAVETATCNGPLTLGKYMNVKSGQIKEGYDADIIALKYNPLDNIKVLQKSKNILMVWKGGKIVKNIWNHREIHAKL